MLSTADALATLLGAAAQIAGKETLPTLEAINRVLAADVISPLDVPPMNTSSMDGYAVRVSELSQGERRLPISQRIPAGHAPQPLAEGTAARIFTGATVPPGADAIVMQEQWKPFGAAGEIVASINEEVFDELDAPVLRVTGEDVPMPYARNLELLAVPHEEDVIAAVRKVMYR